MAAALLAEGTSTITNSPDILDVPLMAEVLRGLGANVEIEGDTVRIMYVHVPFAWLASAGLDRTVRIWDPATGDRKSVV